MPASSSYSQGDVTVLSSSRMMPVPSSVSAPSARRSFSSTSGGSGATSAYSYRTLDRPTYHLNSVSATSSYLTPRPSRYSSDYKTLLSSDLKPSTYVPGSYRARYGTSSMSSSSAASASSSYSSYSRPSTLAASTDTDSRERESGYRSSRLTDSSSSSSYSMRRLEGGTSSSTTTTSRFQRSSDNNDTASSSRYDSGRYSSDSSSRYPSSDTATSRYKASYLSNDTSAAPTSSSAVRPTTLRARIAQDTTEEDNIKEDKRPSVAEIRRLFDPVLADPPPSSRCKELLLESTTTSTPTVTPPVAATPAKLDSDDESEESSSSESEESSSEAEETTTTVTKSPRRSRANPGLPAGSEEGVAENEENSSLEGSSSPTLSGRGKNAGSERGGLVGLRNIGNTCFMNSVLQCLSNTRPLLEFVLGEGHLSELNVTTSAMKGALIKAFATLLQELWRGESDERVVNTSAFKSQVQRFAPRFMGYAQQDAQEFLRYLLEGLHEDVNRVAVRPKPILTEIDDSLSDSQKAMEAWKRYLRRDDSKIVDIFVGQLKSTLRCTVCGHCSVTFDPFWDLSLPIPPGSSHGQVRLAQCFDLFTKEEVLDGDEKPTCSRCQTRQKCTKSFSIHKFPRILVLHLKRFSPMERFRGKLGCTVDFPLSGLDLSAYASASKGGSQQACAYALYGVANHSGTTYSGHYIASCKHPYSGAWHEYNDSRVSSISSRSVVSSEAYVLFYELSGSSGSSSHL